MKRKLKKGKIYLFVCQKSWDYIKKVDITYWEDGNIILHYYDDFVRKNLQVIHFTKQDSKKQEKFNAKDKKNEFIFKKENYELYPQAIIHNTKTNHNSNFRIPKCNVFDFVNLIYSNSNKGKSTFYIKVHALRAIKRKSFEDWFELVQKNEQLNEMIENGYISKKIIHYKKIKKIFYAYYDEKEELSYGRVARFYNKFKNNFEIKHLESFIEIIRGLANLFIRRKKLK